MSLSKNILFGALAGAAATFVMTVTQNRTSWLLEEESAADKKPKKKEVPTTVKTAERIYGRMTGRRLPPESEALAGQLVHYGMGTLMGAGYGAALGLAPKSSIAKGLLWGSIVWLAADEIGIPLAGLSEAPWKTPVKLHAYGLAAHLVYGAALGGFERLEERAAA